jgi:hypothetical protein
LLALNLAYAAWRTRWLDRLSSAQGRRWAWIAVIASAFYAAHRLLPAFQGSWFSTGGFSWRPWYYATYEALVCVSMCIGLICVFRDHLGRAAR